MEIISNFEKEYSIILSKLNNDILITYELNNTICVYKLTDKLSKLIEK